ncbi:MAG: hypothetical protein AAEJ04_04685 [Planctomycetota bacterium]
MISLLEKFLDPEMSVSARVLAYLDTQRPLDHAPESVLQDLDEYWRRTLKAKEITAKSGDRYVNGTDLIEEWLDINFGRRKKEARAAVRARSFARAITPSLDRA